MQAALSGFHHVEQPVVLPALADGRETRRRAVLIAGGGPVGLALALALARHGVATLVVEADTTVCVGSRAICLSRRTLEILDRLGVLASFVDKGLAWTGGRSFHQDAEVLHFTMPHDDDQRLAPMTNLQQYYIEQFLIDEAQRVPDLVVIRWGTRVTDVAKRPDAVVVRMETNGVTYETTADYVVACDGARSQVRQSLGLRLSGTAYEGRYVIVDIELAIDLPTERFAWFDPSSNPGRTMLMHKQPDDLWRLDYQLHSHEDGEAMIRAENVVPIVEAHLAMMGIDAPWRLVWTSTYRAAAVSLENYRHGRVLFAGDAAHLVPIFGVRGLNGGFDDAFNLAWKLASVLEGRAPETLLDSYAEERRHAWQVNVTSAMKSTEFMAPPSRGYEIMRDAVLSLATRHPMLASLINPRQSSAITYDPSALNTVTRDEAAFRAGPPPGAPVPECPLLVGGHARYLTQLLDNRFTLLACLPDTGEADGLLASCDQARRHFSVGVVLVAPGPLPDVAVEMTIATDERNRFADLFDAAPAAFYLVRPDGHVCARWRRLRNGDLLRAIETSLGTAAARMIAA